MADEEFGGLDDDGSSSGSGKGGSLKLIIIIVVVGIIAGAAGFFGNKFLSGGGSNKEQTKETDTTKAGEVKEGDKQPAETQAKENTGENKSGEVKTGEGGTTATQSSGKGLLDLDPFTVNLNDPFGRRYIEVEIKLVIDKKELVDKIKSNELVMPKIRNDILMTISAKSFNDLRTVGGKETLSEEIQMRVNEILKQEMGIEPVIEVLQTKFLMQ